MPNGWKKILLWVSLLLACVGPVFAENAPANPQQAQNGSMLDAPELSAPADESITDNSRPTLRWRSVAGARQYQVVIGTTPNCEGAESPLLTGPSHTLRDSLPQGLYYWCARAISAAGDVSPWSEPNALLINILIRPEDGESLRDNSAILPSFRWSTVVGASGYIFELGRDPEFEDVSSISVGRSTQYRLNDPLGSGTYFWRVIPIGLEPTEIVAYQFIVGVSNLRTPILSSPGNNLRLNTNVPDLVWSTVRDAVTYDIQVSTNASFAIGAQIYRVDEASIQLEPLQDPNQQTYYWRVRAVDENGQVGPWSNSRRFVIDTSVPDAPELSLPFDGSSTNSRPNFRWRTVRGAQQYQIVFGPDPTCEGSLGPIQRGQSYIPVTALEPGLYYWCARAIDSAGNMSEWSQPSSFEVR